MDYYYEAVRADALRSDDRNLGSDTIMSSNRRLDQQLASLIDVSVLLLVILFLLLLGYVLAGATAVMFGADPFPYAFLMLDGDPVFALLGSLIGIFISTGSLSQVFRSILAENDNRAIAINILLSMIALGFGLTTLRISIWPLIDMI